MSVNFVYSNFKCNVKDIHVANKRSGKVNVELAEFAL